MGVYVCVLCDLVVMLQLHHVLIFGSLGGE